MDIRHLAFWCFTLVLGVFVIVPLSLLVLNSFRHVSIGDLEFSLSKLTFLNYIEAYSSPTTFKMLLNSFWFATGSMLMAILLGGSLAFLSERTDLPFRGTIPLMVLIPLITPSIVKGIAWIFLLSPRIGLINSLGYALGFENPLLSAYSLPAMVWVEGVSMSPLAFLLIGATIRRMDPALEEAALGSGASVWKTFSRVTLPLIVPGLAGVAILLFIRGIEAFEIPMLMGFNSGIFVFSTTIYYSLRSAFPPNYGLGFAYSMTLIVLTVAAIILYQRQLRSSERYTVVVGKGYRPRLITLGAWRYLAWALMAFYLVFAAVLPLLILIWGSLLPFYKPPSLQALSMVTLDNYRHLLQSRAILQAVKNTLVLGSVSSISIMFLAVLSSWFVYRTNIVGRKVLDFVVFLPYAVSGMVVGVAFMILFLSFPNPIYNTIWIIVLAYVVNYLPIGTRFTNAAVVQVHKELEEAAWASGAGFWTTLRCIWVPLLTPALINGFLFVLILSFKVMSIAMLLRGPDSTVLSVHLWHLWDSGYPGTAAALAVALVGVVATLSMLARRLGGGLAGGREV
ncbi:MAG: ABC transporter permease [Candidatus Binatia bacterium]